MSIDLEAPPTTPDETMTVEAFLALPEDGIHRELIRGKVRELGMTVRNRFHSRIEARVVQRLLNWLDAQPEPRGEIVCGEAGFRLKGTKESLVGVDVALVSAELVAKTPAKQSIYDGAPLLAVEILSPRDTHEDTVETVSAYLEVGSVVWVVDPDFQTVTIHRPGEPAQPLTARQELAGDPYLPGFRVCVADLFS